MGVSVSREHNRSAEDKRTYQQWVETMEPIYNNIFHFTRVSCYGILITASHLRQPKLKSFFPLQRISVVSDSQVIFLTLLRTVILYLTSDNLALLLSAVSNRRRCSASLHHEAQQQEVHLAEEQTETLASCSLLTFDRVGSHSSRGG